MNDENVRIALAAVQRLTLEEVRRLNEMLGYRDEEEGGVGVREPRRPLPEGPEVQDLPDDYWETAQ